MTLTKEDNHARVYVGTTYDLRETLESTETVGELRDALAEIIEDLNLPPQTELDRVEVHQGNLSISLKDPIYQ